MTEQDNILRKRFFAFLNENNAYDKWVYNLKHEALNSDSTCQWLFEDNSNEAIIRAFIWDETKEGQYFWSELNHKWHDYILDLIEQKETLYD